MSRLTPSSIYYHSSVLDIFQPFLQSKALSKSFASEQPFASEQSFASERFTPQDIFTTLVKRLRWHVIMHSLVHLQSRYGLFWQTALFQVANACLTVLQSSKCLLYFLLCVHGFVNIASCFPIIRRVARVLLAVVIYIGILSTKQGENLLNILVKSFEQRIQLHQPNAAISVDLQGKLLGLEEARI